MTEPDRDWTELAATWQSARLPQSDADWLRARIGIKRRRVFWSHVADSGAAALLIGIATWVGWNASDPWLQLWAGTVLALTVAVFALVTWNRRDLWHPAADSVRDHLVWCRRRCRRQLATIRLAWLVYVVMALVHLLLVRFHPVAPEGADLVWTAAFLGAFAAGLAVWSAWYGRAVRRELMRLDGLRTEYE